ncbi:uncharacterized protein [Venturia canescens]|uniref:uncharacterized protein n=1 Tax=Venturia canescens TaxID=32260 RepID=UPI001C9C5764|nr:uncharacterized protein LOC122416915 [Venturia canescens]
MSKKTSFSINEAAASVRKILGPEGLENIPKHNSPVWKTISQDLRGEWKASTIYKYVIEDRYQLLTLARIKLEPETSEENSNPRSNWIQTLSTIKEEFESDKLSTVRKANLVSEHQSSTDTKKSLCRKCNELKEEEAEKFALFAETLLKSSVIVSPQRGEVSANISEYKLSCDGCSLYLPITLDIESFRKSLADGKCSSFCKGPRSLMVFQYKDEFRLHAKCQTCGEIEMYSASQTSKKVNFDMWNWKPH